MAPRANKLHHYRTRHSLSTDHAVMRKQVAQVIGRKTSLKEKPLVPVLQRFKDFIEGDALIRMLANEMFQEVPITPPYNNDPALHPQIRNYDEMLECLNVIISEGPPWFTSDNADGMGLVGFPIIAILTWPMGTRSGYEFFTKPAVNAHWKAVLDERKTFLSSPESVSVLNSANGWTDSDATQMLTDKGNDRSDNYTFAQLYQCDPSAQYYGFKSWDDFFTRHFNDDIRPIAYPDGVISPIPDVDPTTVIVHAAESTPSFRRENVQLHDTFWLKSQPYSLADMLNGEKIAEPFVGGQVYQAYLPALNYHRWHAPVSGTVISVENVAGTYYSANYYEGFANTVDGEPKPDPSAPNNSEAYIAQVATRCIIIVQADNQKIGLMAMVFIGMCECSSCEFYFKPGDRINKGHPIGTFHFGGSSHCLVFRSQTPLKFIDPGPYEHLQNNKKINSLLARVV